MASDMGSIAGWQIGDQRFVWIDTEKQMWEYAD